MNFKKVFGTTVDKMTLSYTERHLKEAFEQENDVPTTILQVIAEKSHNEHNVKSIELFFDKAFKHDFKDWKRFRNLVKMIEYLLKFGSIEVVSCIRKYQNNIRILQNYNLMETGIDKGAQIRHSAIQIGILLTNIKELEALREESKKLREKYKGISSDDAENYKSYNNYDKSYNNYDKNYNPVDNRSSSFNNPPNVFTNQYSRDYGTQRYDPKNQKLAESIFGTTENYDPNPVQNSENTSYSAKNISNQQNYHIEKPVVNDIFGIPNKKESDSKPPDIFANVIKKDLQTIHKNEPQSSIDIFNTFTDSKVSEKVNPESGKTTFPDIFSEKKVPNIFENIPVLKNQPKPSENRNSGSDIFEPVPKTFDSQSTSKLFVSLDYKSNSAIGPSKPDLFSGMKQRDNKTEEKKSLEVPQESKPQWNLDFLNLTYEPFSQTSSVPVKQQDIIITKPKVKCNLIEEPIVISAPPAPSIKKVLSPQELESKLMDLNF